MENQMAPICRKEKMKNYIAAAMAAIVILAYLVYQYFYFEQDVKLNELYFSVTSFVIGVNLLLLKTYMRNLHIKSLLLLIGSFYLILLVIYDYNWVFLDKAHTSIKFSLIGGFGIALIYWTYGIWRYRNHFKH